MFKYIKKLTSVVVMFAVIIVFSSSKVYAESAFSIPPNVEKSAEVVGIVNDIVTLTNIGLKSRQDVNDDKVDKVKADKAFKKFLLQLNTKVVNLNIKVVNIVTVNAINHFFSPTDSKKLDTFLSSRIGVSPSVPEKNIGLRIGHYKTNDNKISPLNVLYVTRTISPFSVLAVAAANNFTVNISNNLPKLNYRVPCILEIKAQKSNTLSSGRYYEAVQEADGSWILSDAGLKQFLIDDAIIREGDGEGNDGGDKM